MISSCRRQSQMHGVSIGIQLSASTAITKGIFSNSLHCPKHLSQQWLRRDLSPIEILKHVAQHVEHFLIVCNPVATRMSTKLRGARAPIFLHWHRIHHVFRKNGKRQCRMIAPAQRADRIVCQHRSQNPAGYVQLRRAYPTECQVLQ